MFDPAVINVDAARWARQYSYDLVSKLTDTTRRVVGNAVSSFIETPEMTIGDLRRQLEPAFGPVRSEMIAITEVTRAYSAATNQTQQRLNQTGLPMQRVWLTRNDEKTCILCGPLDGKPESVWAAEFPDGPPRHPNCRCSLGLEVVA